MLIELDGALYLASGYDFGKAQTIYHILMLSKMC